MVILEKLKFLFFFENLYIELYYDVLVICKAEGDGLVRISWMKFFLVNIVFYFIIMGGIMNFFKV